MIRSRLWMLGLVSIACAGLAHAQSLVDPSHFFIDLTGGSTPGDPRISIDSTCCSDAVNSTSFEITPSSSDSGFLGGGQFDLFNNSGQNWFNLDFTATFPGITLTQDEFQCDVNGDVAHPFSSCGITVHGDTVNILFSGGTGIPTQFLDGPPQNFTPTTNTNGGWQENGAPVVLGAHANVPEPSTLLLLVTAAGALAARRKLLASRR